MPSTRQALVGIVMGSQSDWPTMEQAAITLKTLNIPFEHSIVSAHRTPDRLFQYAEQADKNGLKVIIAGAGGAAHLPGMLAAKTHLPILGVPIQSNALKGLDSLLSIVQMPKGVPVATLAIGTAGAVNAAILAASILANQFADIKQNLLNFRQRQTQEVLNNTNPQRLNNVE